MKKIVAKYFQKSWPAKSQVFKGMIFGSIKLFQTLNLFIKSIHAADQTGSYHLKERIISKKRFKLRKFSLT
jgi:hypothetical protein